MLNFFVKAIKGYRGEKITKEILKNLNKDDFSFFHDVMFFYGDMKTVQMDFLIISRFGIYIVETKNWNGILKGDCQSKYWQLNKKRVYSPSMQVYAHKQILTRLLSYTKDDKRFFPIVHIVGSCSLEGKICNNVTRNLLDKITLREEIKFSRAEIKEIKEEIEHRRLKNTISAKIKHIWQVKKMR